MAVNYGPRRLTTGAHYGLRDWIAQRVTAVIVALFVLLLVVCTICTSGPLTHETWVGIFKPQWMKFISFAAIIAIAWHAWVGIRDLWMDYIKSAGLRLTLHVLTLVWLVGTAGWAIQVLWKV